MNRFFTLLLAASCLTVVGQTEYPYPYNPDGNNDGYISLNDLLDLLSVYGSEFNAGVLATDSTSAIFYTGEMDYWDCASSCVGLKGNWKVLDCSLIGTYREVILSDGEGEHWLDHRSVTNYCQNPFTSLAFWNDVLDVSAAQPSANSLGCWCQTRTRADIEDINVCEGLQDECGVCNGEGAIYECGCSDIPEGDCDCEGNQLDAIGVCGGDCIEDADGDGVCDPVLGPCEGQGLVTYHGYDYEIVETADGRCWFAENLRTSDWSNGEAIPNDWPSANSSPYASHLDFIQPCFVEIDGVHYYNGAVAFNELNCCPSGWHVPEKGEWEALFNAYAESAQALLKICGPGYNWDFVLPYPTNGSDGLNLESRSYVGAGSIYPNDNNSTRHWSSTEVGNNVSIWYPRFRFHSNEPMGLEMVYTSGKYGHPIRCIKD